MKTILPLSIDTIEAAKKFLTDLVNNNEAFHPEDDAHEIVWELPKDQQPTVLERNRLNKLMEDIYNLKGNDGRHDNSIAFCPCGFIIDIANNQN